MEETRNAEDRVEIPENNVLQGEAYNEYEEYDKPMLRRMWDKIMRSGSGNDEDSLRIAAGIILCMGIIASLYLLFTLSFIKTLST